MIKVIMTALVAIAFFATATERGFSPVSALIMGAGAALGMYYIYLKIEELEAQYEKRHSRCVKRKIKKCRRQAAAEDALSAKSGGTYRSGQSNRSTYARYARLSSDMPEKDLSSAMGTRVKRDSATALPIRKVCGVLSYDYYRPDVGDRKEIL